MQNQDKSTNEWNDYDPAVEPDIWRWIEWNVATFQGLPQKSIRQANRTYHVWNNGAREIGIRPFEWGHFSNDGQWRYCYAPYDDYEKTESNVQNRHNDHYEALAPHKPFDVFEVWVKANEDLFKQHPTLSGYYLPVLKHLGRLDLKDGETPIKNLEKTLVYIQKMIDTLKSSEG